MFSPARLLLLSLVLLYACSADPADWTEPAAGQNVSQRLGELITEERWAAAADGLVAGARGAERTYVEAALDYHAGRLPEALALARRANAGLGRGEVPDTALAARVYHLLALLHFDHAAFTDSIGYYQRRAADLLDADSALPLRVEQLLCLSLNQVYQYTFTTQVTAARLGRQLLQDDECVYPDKLGRLLVAEALGTKKFADLQPDHAREAMYRQGIRLLERAAALFRRHGNVRWREAEREKAIIIARLQDRPWFSATVDALQVDGEDGTPFGFADRLWGYYHHQGQRPDSVLYYYRRFLVRAPAFDAHLQDETRWSLIQYGIMTGDTELAEAQVLAQLRLYRCGDPPDPTLPLPPQLPHLANRFTCQYALCDLGRIALYRYHSGDTNALSDAVAIFEHILDQWENLFLTGEEEGAKAQVDNITHKIIRNANEAAYLLLQERPGRRQTDALLRNLERTKSFLLLKDRGADQSAASASVGAEADSLRYWQSRINLLKAAEMRRGITRAEREEMLSLSAKHLRTSREVLDSRTAQIRKERHGIPGLTTLRASLADSAAVLVYGEGVEALVGLYIDRDTTVSFRTGSVADLTLAVEAFLETLAVGNQRAEPAAYERIGRRLYQELLGPVQQPLRSVARLTIVPAGPLPRMPFAALPTDTVRAGRWSTQPYLVRNVAVTYTPSLRYYLNGRRTRHHLVDRDPQIGTWVSPDVEAYFAGVKDVVGRQPRARLFTGVACNSSTFLRGMERFGVLNLAVHARGDATRNYGNYLYFSSSDSLNTASLGQLDCRARLVYLAACETGVGPTTAGEGSFSTARTFQQLGVPDIVYSLWRVPAGASADVQAAFYRHWLAGVPADEALARAQRTMARRRGRMAFPGNWAGMVKG